MKLWAGIWLVLFVAACTQVPLLFKDLKKTHVDSHAVNILLGQLAAAGPRYYEISGFSDVSLVPPRNVRSLFAASKAIAIVVDEHGLVHVRNGSTVPCNETIMADPLAVTRIAGQYRRPPKKHMIVMVRQYCGFVYDNVLGDDIIHTPEMPATNDAVRSLAITDSITIPLALAAHGYVLGRYRHIVLPVVSAVVTTVVSMGILAQFQNWEIPTIATNIQSALALALAIDYSMFLVHSPRGAHTVAVSGFILFVSSLTIQLVSTTSIKAIGLAATIAIAVAVAVNLTLIRKIAPKHDISDAKLLDLSEPQPLFVSRHPVLIVVAATLLVAVSVFLTTKIQFCGGTICTSAKTSELSTYASLQYDPNPTTVLMTANVSHCAGAMLQRTYAVDGQHYMDVATAIHNSGSYNEQMTTLLSCIGHRGSILNHSFLEYELMRRTLHQFATVGAVALALVFFVMLCVYRAPVLAVKAILIVVATFVVAVAFLAITQNFELCWVVPIITMPLVVGIGMDFHVFFLDGVEDTSPDSVLQACHTTRRITNGAGVILGVAFIGLLAVPIKMVQQVAIFLVAAVIIDTAFMRPLLVPAAMLLIGRYNYFFALLRPPFFQSSVQAR